MSSEASKGREVEAEPSSQRKAGDVAWPRGFETLLAQQSIVALDPEVLPELLEEAEVIREVDTCLSGWIRVLRFGRQVAVQEQTPEGEILLRRLNSRESAEQFVARRLRGYERMWDGCGCKIDYHH